MRAQKSRWEKTETGLYVPSIEMGGDVSEDAVQLLSESSFFADFVFRSPQRENGKHLREITDVLIWFDNQLISVQVKGMDDEAPNEKDVEDWVRTNLAKAYSQAKGVKRHFKMGKNRSFLFNELQGNTQIDPETIDKIHSLIVLDHPQHKYLPSDLIPELQNPDLATHIFSLEDFRNVCAEFSTIPDFVCYLNDRETLMKKEPIEVGRETDFLAWYILSRPYQKDERFQGDIAEGLGDHFLATYRERLNKRSIAKEPLNNRPKQTGCG